MDSHSAHSNSINWLQARKIVVCTCTLKLSGLISKREGLAYKTLISEYKVHVVSMKRT